MTKQIPFDLRGISPVDLLVEINDTKLVVFDTSDFGEIKADLINGVDAYFKRSFPLHQDFPASLRTKFFPLGLTYCVYPKKPDSFEFKRSFLEKKIKEKFKHLLKTSVHLLGSKNPLRFRFNITNCSHPPEPNLSPAIIFMCRLWDPLETKPKYRQQREEINLMRVNCIRGLKREFGKRFMGGLSHNEYTIKNFPDCLITDPQLTQFGNYVRLMQNFPIGVATTGLHESIGWKFAEYVAFSKAIVSEKLEYFVPELNDGSNYLGFTNVEECIHQTTLLMENKEKREAMMEANYQHYQQYGRPDLLVWNAITKVV